MREAAGEWTCKVSLRFETDEQGKPVESVIERPFGTPVQKPHEVEALLRRAQLAILNPSVTDSTYFLEMDDKDVQSAKKGNKPPKSAKQLTFSTNVICVDVEGSDVTDLTFLDLPVRLLLSSLATSANFRYSAQGLIEHSKGEKDVELIESMVKKAIQGKCLVLSIISMKGARRFRHVFFLFDQAFSFSVDYQNQKGVVLAREADPEGGRTIGTISSSSTARLKS